VARKTSRKPQSPLKGFADAFSFALDCQEVVGRRLARIARGDAGALIEAQRMVAEKLNVAAAASMAAAFAWPLGVEVATAKAASHYQKAVRANRRRLRGGA
jgi:hypothetical protein